MPEHKQKILIIHETTLQSWLKDAWTFGCIAGLAWFNHRYLIGSWVLDGFAVVAACITGIIKTSNWSVTVVELREMLERGDL